MKEKKIYKKKRKEKKKRKGKGGKKKWSINYLKCSLNVFINLTTTISIQIAHKKS
jgi:hypothetical protein